MIVRAFTYAHVIINPGGYKLVHYWSVEGSECIVDIFDGDGKATCDGRVWEWATHLKKQDKASGLR